MAAAPQGGGQPDNSMSIIWTIAAVFLALGVIWYLFKDQIAYAYLFLKFYEVKALNLVMGNKFSSLQDLIGFLLENPGRVSMDDLGNIGDKVGDYVRWPFIVLFVFFAGVVYLTNKSVLFKRTYNMKQFASLEKENWPQIRPVADLDLIKVDIDQGPWAMAMTPMQFCKRHRLLDEIRPQRREGMARKEWDKIDVVLKRGEANKIFALQLGPLWKGSDRLPPYVRALYAVFAARINADSKAAANLLAQLAASSTTKLNTAGTDELIKKHENTKPVQHILKTHAYMLTVMASMLAGAREDGVQASADFLWLKPLDRRLWYVLNEVGRQTPFVEVAGVFAHWVAEREAGKRLLVPMVEEAGKALELALKEVVYKPDEETESRG